MKVKGIRLVLVVAALMVPASVVAAAAAEEPEEAWATALAEVHQRRFQAMVDADAEALAGLLAEELTYVHSNGERQGKDELLATLAGGELRYLAIRPEGDLAIRFYGDGAVGVLTGVARFQAQRGEQELEATLRYTSVYVRRDGGWWLVAWHSSAVGDGRG